MESMDILTPRRNEMLTLLLLAFPYYGMLLFTQQQSDCLCLINCTCLLTYTKLSVHCKYQVNYNNAFNISTMSIMYCVSSISYL